MATYYISQNGNDTYGLGTESAPWASLYKACSVVTSGNTIYVSGGTYIENFTCYLSVGVNILGSGSGTTTIISNLSSSYLLILNSSSNHNEQGNQSISEIKFDGNNLTARNCISVNYRGGVSIHNCEFRNFYSGAVSFAGYYNPENQKVSSFEWVTNNKFYNNITYNNTQANVWPHNLWIQGQDYFECYNNTMTENQRGSNEGNCIGSHGTRRLRIYNNNLTRGPFILGTWHFAMEIRYNYGENEIHDNIINGESDVTYIWKESLSYGLKYYNNICGPPSPTYSGDVGLQLEADSYSVEVYNNTFKNVYAAFYISSTTVGSNYEWNHVSGITFRNNLCYNMTPWTYPWNFLGNGIYMVGINSTTWNNIYIYNNTFISIESGTTTSQSGIRLANGGTMTNCEIKNNIFLGFGNASIYASPEASNIVSINNLSIFNNISYRCGNSNNPSFVSVTLTNYTSGNTIKSDPLLSSNYHLLTNSPAINAGVYVGLPYSGSAPDIGAFETPTTYYLSPHGNDNTNNGLSLSSPWFSINKAWGYVVSGDTILMSGGTYVYNTQQQLFNKSGSSGNTIKIWSMENQFPKITRPTGSSIQYGIYMYNSNYIHIKGLEIYGYLQPGTAGNYNSILGYDVNNCVFENLKLHDSVYGLALGNASAGSIGSAGNLILNVDSYNCYDPYSTNGQGAYENANAFSFNGQINNNPNGPNVFRNCRAFLCCDDGWDMFGSNADYIYENCWAFWNGYLLSGGTVVYDDNGYILSGGTIVLAVGIGNGEGFKMGPLEYGGTYAQDRSTEIQSKLYNCVSFYNSDHGFAQNYAKARILLYNCTSFGNGSAGYNLSDWSGQPYAPANGLNLQINHILINCLSYNNNIRIGNFNSYSTIDHNSFGYQSYDPPYNMYGTGTVRLNVTDNDFVTLNPTGDTINVLSSRNQDGTLPSINFLNLTASSILRNAGTPVGLPYQDNYPDIGAFEYYVAFKVVKILNKVLTRNGKVIIK